MIVSVFVGLGFVCVVFAIAIFAGLIPKSIVDKATASMVVIFVIFCILSACLSHEKPTVVNTTSQSIKVNSQGQSQYEMRKIDNDTTNYTFNLTNGHKRTIKNLKIVYNQSKVSKLVTEKRVYVIDVLSMHIEIPANTQTVAYLAK